MLDTLTDPATAPPPPTEAPKTPEAGLSQVSPTADEAAASDVEIDQLLAAEARSVLARAAADEEAQVQEEEKAALAEALADAPPVAPEPPAPSVEAAEPLHGCYRIGVRRTEPRLSR